MSADGSAPEHQSLAALQRFDGRAAIVTGGASGMGAAMALRLAEAGASVVVVDIDGAAAESVAAKLPSGTAVRADVSVEADVVAYVRAAVDAFGSVDLFFNNAGLLGRAVPLVDSTSADYEHVFGINTRGMYLGLREVGRQMLAQGRGGSIVCTASIAGLRSSPGVGLYSASKWAVLGLARTAAKELGAAGIRVNAICPGITNTNFSAPLDETDPVSVALHGARLAKIPLGRFAAGDDQARAAMWLLSDAASFVSGVMLPVDGGQEA